MSFDSLAPYYRGLEALVAGKLLQQCRTAFLAQAADARSALLLGEGPGRYLIELLIVNPRIRVTSVASSAGMLVVAKKQLASCGLADRPVEFVCADWADWPGEGGPF